MSHALWNRQRRYGLLVLALVTVVGLLVVAVPPANSAGPLVVSYADPTIDSPYGVTTGPDGALWFANEANNSIGRLATSPGQGITNYTAPSIDAPSGITAGPDGALWFTNFGNNSIGRITTAGVVTNYTATTIHSPYGITAGADGALWFTNQGNSSIGRITTAGVVTNYTTTTIDSPHAITAGPDGALWFTNFGNNSIGRITTAGVVTNYTAPSMSGPEGITAGPDGALWFTAYTSNQIGRITTAGVVTNLYANYQPTAITTGPDGALWFTESQQVGRITTAGVETAYGPIYQVTGALGITAGPEGFLWLSNDQNNTIVSVDPAIADPLPTVTSVSPNSGPTTGNTTITITGTNFVAGSGVVIGQGKGVTGGVFPKIDSITPTTITATTDPGIAGTFNVYVETPGGTSVATTGDDFTYISPTGVPAISAVSPNAGPYTGGTPITITGTGFAPGATVEIGQGHGAGPTAALALDVDVVSSTKITAVTGDASPGLFNVFVITPGGTSAANTGSEFTYNYDIPVPTVSAVTPTTGPRTGGTQITITGTNLISVTTVEIGQGGGAGSTAIKATIKTYSQNTITAVTGGGALAGTFNVYVITAGGTSPANLHDDFTYS